MTSIKTLALGAVTIASALSAWAAIPENYYSSLDGKQGAELASAVAALAKGHERITYNTKTWPAFEKTDVRVINGKECWWDMYSNNIVWLPAHDALNIEHSVANSWWGGKSGNADAYADLFHLNPSDQLANNKKSSYPYGEVADPRILDNGLSMIGTPKDGSGGGATTVFEPADEYKGDFARAILYVFSAYGDATWDAGWDKGASNMLELVDGAYQIQPWAVEMLLRWSENDPVDTKEYNRNEEVYLVQKNRNPFIDYPQLAQYVWGDKKSQNFSLDAEASVQVSDRPAAPVFGEAWMVGVNTYAKRWWDSMPLDLRVEEGTLMLSVDGGDYYEPSDLQIDGAGVAHEKHTYRAYVTKEVNGKTLSSSVSTLTLAALDPTETDYSVARWEKLTAGDQIGEGYYILLSSNTLHPMSTVGGTSTQQFLDEAGFANIDEDGLVTELQSSAAIVRFEPSEDGKYRLMVYDVLGNSLGSWNANTKNKMRLSDETYTPGTVAVNENDEFEFQIGAYSDGSEVKNAPIQIKFNKTQPRFVNYESNSSGTAPIYIYRFKDFEHGTSSITGMPEVTPSVGVDGNNIIAPAGSPVYDLNGRAVNGRDLRPGIYIVVGGGKSVKIML